MPYDSLIIPFSYYFSKNSDKPTGNIKSYLETIFWHTSLSEAYSNSSNQEIAKDLEKIKTILIKKEKPEFEFTKAQLINTHKIEADGEFKPSRSFIKAILCCLNKQNIQNIFSGSNIILENDWLKQSNSNQYHHFFPKKYITDRNKNKTLKKYNLVNNIANIVLIDAQANQKIGAKGPEVYLPNCKKNIEDNSGDFNSVLMSNLLPKFDDEFELYADFDSFIDWRIKKIVDTVRDTIKIIE